MTKKDSLKAFPAAGAGAEVIRTCTISGLCLLAAAVLIPALLLGAGIEVIGPEPAAVRERAEAVLQDANLLETAKTLEDGRAVVGLAFLARGESRQTLGEMAIALDAGSAPVLAVIDTREGGAGLSADHVKVILTVDGTNALGPFLESCLHFSTGDGEAGLEAWRRGMSLDRIDTYERHIAADVFAALEALGLEGADRLWALYIASSMKPDMWRFLVEIPGNVAQASETLSASEQKAVALGLLEMAGVFEKLGNSELFARFVASRALTGAYEIEARVARETSKPKAAAYDAIVEAVGSYTWDLPSIGQDEEFYSAVGRAFAKEVKLADVSGEEELSERSASLVSAALEEKRKAARDFLLAASRQPDASLGLWLETASPLSQITDNQYELIYSTETFNDICRKADETIEQNAPLYGNRLRMEMIAAALLTCAYQSGNRLPDDLDSLYGSGYISRDTLARPVSVHSGQSYTYPGSGLPWGDDAAADRKLVLIYDPFELPGGVVQVVYGDGKVTRDSKARVEAAAALQAGENADNS